MLDLLFNQPLSFLIWAFALLIAVSIHEFSHAWAADKLGDPTPRLAGRLTLNPLAHLDPLGTIALLIARVGWGKPVPIDPYNFKNPRKDSALASLAGPASNLIFALVISIIAKLLTTTGLFGYWIVVLTMPMLVLNVGLAVFNLIPVPPLDGAKILSGILPLEKALRFEESMSQYGIILLIFLILPLFNGVSLISIIIYPIIDFLVQLLL